MGKKILFAVMALLVMATGNIWAQMPYALLCPNGDNTYTMYFVYTSDDVNTRDTGGEIKGGSSDSETLIYTKAWEIDPESTGGPEWKRADDKGSITEVVFEESFEAVKVTSCNGWFEDFTSLSKIIGIENLNTSQVTEMTYMFNGCSKLTSLDLNKFNTSKVENMCNMFQGCSGLTTLDLSSFNTSKVTNMSGMFNKCGKLTTLNLSSFNTSSVTNMSSMFRDCSGLKSLTLSSFNTSKVTEMTNMFYRCSSLTTLDLRSFNTSKVTEMSSMFNGCSNLTTLDLSSFDMSGVANENNVYGMFYQCPKNITINDNALVFVTSDTQKGVWNEFKNNVNFVEKEGDTYKYGGNITIDYSTGNETAPLVFSQKFTANSVTFTRTFTAGYPHTVCLPFAVNATEYGTFYTFKEYKDNKVFFEKLTADKTTTTANTPYLFIPKDGITEITAKNTVISSTTDDNMHNTDNFIGVYDKMTFTAEFLAETSDYDYYGWTSNSDGMGYFRKAGEDASVAPCRAYIRLAKETTGGSNNAPARLSVEFDDGDTTGIDTIGTAKSGADGGADAPMYNLHGQRVSGGYKGVVIKNGKKMIVK